VPLCPPKTYVVEYDEGRHALVPVAHLTFQIGEACFPRIRKPWLRLNSLLRSPRIGRNLAELLPPGEPLALRPI
jgi:hypothetical protein